MFFGVLSMNTFWFGYYAVSKWGRKPLAGMKLALISFWIMEGAVILLFSDVVLNFGAGWYNLMALAFLPGFPAITWHLSAAIIFQIACRYSCVHGYSYFAIHKFMNPNYILNSR
jgi:hypothetical protein